MISVSTALDLVLNARMSWGTEEISLPQAIGRYLAETVYADRDFPPFDRVTMDGIALFIDAPRSEGSFRIAATQYAGEAPQSLSSRDSAIEVMTGAVLPTGTNTVIRYEDLTFSEQDGARVASIQASVTPKQNIHFQGMDRAAGSVLIPAQTRIGSSEIGTLASVGQHTVSVLKRPRIALISTGDELVDVHETPLPHQIRRSSVYQLQSALAELKFDSQLFHLTDTPETLETELETILNQYEVVLMTGGVSAGKKDFIPETLQKLGVEKHLHQVAQRPGKPFWFGVRPDQNAVFALPGNPVSTFVCFLQYVKPFLLPSYTEAKAVLAESVSFKPSLTYFIPVSARIDATGRLLAYPLKGSGSGDFANLLECTGFLQLPAETSEFAAGELAPYLPFRSFV